MISKDAMTITCIKCKKVFDVRKSVITAEATMCINCYEHDKAGVLLANASLALMELDFDDVADADWFHNLMEELNIGANLLLWNKR